MPAAPTPCRLERSHLEHARHHAEGRGSHLEHACHHAEGRGASSGGSPPGNEVLQLPRAQVPSAQDSGPTSHHGTRKCRPFVCSGGKERSTMTFGAYLQSVPRIPADVLCPAASPRPPGPPRPLPTSPLDTPGAQDHGPPAGRPPPPGLSRGAHTREPTLPKGSGAESCLSWPPLGPCQ